MKKTLLDEMIDELNKLRDSQKKVSVPLPPKPEEVFKVIGRVAEEHEVTAEDMAAAMALRISTPGSEINSSDISTYSELRDSKK